MNRLWLGGDFRRVFLEALILAIVAFAVGLSVNFTIVFNAFEGKNITSSLSHESAGKIAESSVSDADLLPFPVVLEEIDELLAAGAVLIDARNSSAYEKAHLQGAISLPLGQAKKDIAEFQKSVPADKTLILYCSGFGCPDSFDLGVLLLQAGYTDVLVYEGGFPEWQDAGRPLAGKGID